jgi:hypothetical protein
LNARISSARGGRGGVGEERVLRIRAPGKVSTGQDVIGMDVGVDHVPELYSESGGIVQVSIRLAEGIDHRRDLVPGAADEIGSRHHGLDVEILAQDHVPPCM